jgi:molybdopterin-guanine dinucleotide biosynthesis protein A/isopentenyldiphosphate isomerase
MGTAKLPVAGVIVAGGRASRMGGRDKAFAAVGGEPIVVRTIRLFRELFPQVLVVTNRPEPYRELGVDTVSDRFPGCGPLAGIHTALLASRYPHAFVAACDMPGLDAGVIRFLAARIGDADAIVPRWEGDVEPLHAVYAARCVPAIEAHLASGRHALREFLGSVRVDYVSEAELRALPGAAASLTNVNTPEELAAVGGRFATRSDPGAELVDVVGDAGETIAVASRREMRARRLPHRSAYVLVFNAGDELFVHLRAASKDVYPSHWDPAIGGVLAAGESFDDGARREAAEELGVAVEPERLFPFHYADAATVVHGMVYRARHEGPFRLQPEEIVRGEFMPLERVLALAAREPFCPDGLAVLRDPRLRLGPRKN